MKSYNEFLGALSLMQFEDVMSHVFRINRILELPSGACNGMLASGEIQELFVDVEIDNIIQTIAQEV